MNLYGQIKALLCAVTLACSLSGCFTGIESTPRITASDVRRETAQTVTPEQTFGRTLVADSLSQWRKGREFKVVDDRIKLLFSSTRDSSLPAVGEIIEYAGITTVPSLLGDTITLLKFVTPKSPADTLIYRVEFPPAELYGRQSISVPFVVDMEYISKIDSKMTGMTLYPLTSTRYAENGERVNCRKFIPVTVVGVSSGNADFPLRVNFTESGDPKIYSVLMSSGTGKMSTRNFDSLFSLSDPRLKYPLITDQNWEAITNGTVRPEMTREEVRLSLGNPQDVLHGHSYSSTYERWVYPSGAMLEFEDGLLKKFRL